MDEPMKPEERLAELPKGSISSNEESPETNLLIREDTFMRITKKALAFTLSLILLLSVYGFAAAEQTVRKMESASDADEWVSVFLGEHPEELDGKWAMTDQMEQALSMYGGLSGLAGSLAPCGTVEKIFPACEEKLQGYPAMVIPVVFSLQRLDVILILEDGAIAGLQFGSYTGPQEETASDAFVNRDLSLPVPSLNGELPGTLTLPAGEGPFPAVVLIHGSGPCDRDETIGVQKPFRDLAEGLAEKEIAVYRFDKRTYVYGSQMAGNRYVTLMDESVWDAVAAVQLLSETDGIDPDRIFVLGHSLGGNAIPAIAGELENASEKACGFIMMAASPRPLDMLMREQYAFLYSLVPELTPELRAEKDAVFSELDRLQELDSMADSEMIMGAFAPYWKWLAAYDAIQAGEKLVQPVLVLQGEEDYQVSMVDFNLWEKAFSDKENWTMKSFPGLTHAFTAGQKAEGASVYYHDEKVDKQVIQDIADFILRTE